MKTFVNAFYSDWKLIKCLHVGLHVYHLLKTRKNWDVSAELSYKELFWSYVWWKLLWIRLSFQNWNNAINEHQKSVWNCYEFHSLMGRIDLKDVLTSFYKHLVRSNRGTIFIWQPMTPLPWRSRDSRLRAQFKWQKSVCLLCRSSWIDPKEFAVCNKEDV